MPSDPTMPQPQSKVRPPVSGAGAPPEQQQSEPPKFAGRTNIISLGTYLMVVLVLLVYLLLKIWPTEIPVPGNPDETTWLKEETLPLVRDPLKIPDEVRVLLVVLAAGAIGSMVHTIRSFVGFAGNRQLVTSWIPWYVLRPASGAALALVFYLVVRAGLIDTGVGESGFSIGGVAALAALVGLFSEQASEKLKEVFATLLATREPARTADQLKTATPNPKPEPSALAPESLVAGSAALSVTITGKKFAAGAEVRVNCQSRGTEVKSDTEAVFKLVAQDVATPGDKTVTIVNPPPGGGESDPLILKVTA